MRSIRRAGERGTTVKNWWINFSLWSLSIADNPWVLLNPNAHRVIGIDGKRRWWAGIFEGVDSLCRTCPPFGPPNTRDVNAEYFLAVWRRAGFDMKIRLPGVTDATDFAEFCGTQFLLKNHDLEGSWCPDLPRALKNSGWCFFQSCSGNPQDRHWTPLRVPCFQGSFKGSVKSSLWVRES